MECEKSRQSLFAECFVTRAVYLSARLGFQGRCEGRCWESGPTSSCRASRPGWVGHPRC